jgi:hypothetical protein
MHPLIRQWLAAEHTREMCTRADRARLAALTIRGRRRPRYRALLPGSPDAADRPSARTSRWQLKEIVKQVKRHGGKGRLPSVT